MPLLYYLPLLNVILKSIKTPTLVLGRVIIKPEIL